jgi:hypothetical protein
MRGHLVAWFRYEKKAPSFLCFGRPGYALHRTIVHSDFGRITADTKTRVRAVQEQARFGQLTSISFAGPFPDAKRPLAESWSALYLLITCSKDLATPMVHGWRLRGAKPNIVDRASPLQKPAILVEPTWNEMFDFV